MLHSLTGAITAALLFLVTGYAQDASFSSLAKLAIEHYTLSNGMDVILCRDSRIPSVQLNLRFRVGSKNERPGRHGFAHLFEHIMYDGVEPDADFQTLTERIGATGVDGKTTPDYTQFSEAVPFGPPGTHALVGIQSAGQASPNVDADKIRQAAGSGSQ
jgi:hypothetical protein